MKKKAGKKWIWLAVVVVVVLIGALVVSAASSGGKLLVVGSPSNEFAAFTWPDSGLAAEVPAVENPTGKIEQATDDEFSVYLADISAEDYEAYITACTDAGYTVGAVHMDNSYMAQNAAGVTLAMSYNKSESVLMLNATREAE